MCAAKLSATAQLATLLVQKPSITPHDAGCQALLAKRLEPYAFKAHPLRYGDVDNLWLIRESRDSHPQTTLVFVGHTDVVPPGNTASWRFDPFSATVENGILYGRGIVDMKGAIAAFVSACETFLDAHPQTALRIGLLLTSSEEVYSENGIYRVNTWLAQHNEPCPHILIGEPSSLHRVGDQVRKGRRGSLTGKVTFKGTQGHVAYTQSSDNIIHLTLPKLAKLVQIHWGGSTDIFPPPSFHITHLASVSDDPIGNNVVPEALTCHFNVRFPPHFDVEHFKTQAEELTQTPISWELSGQPFLSQEGRLAQAIRSAKWPHPTAFTVDGGTSDGRFLASPNREIMELGLIGTNQAHAVNESAPLNDLDTLTNLYGAILEHFTPSSPASPIPSSGPSVSKPVGIGKDLWGDELG